MVVVPVIDGVADQIGSSQHAPSHHDDLRAICPRTVDRATGISSRGIEAVVLPIFEDVGKPRDADDTATVSGTERKPRYSRAMRACRLQAVADRVVLDVFERASRAGA